MRGADRPPMAATQIKSTSPQEASIAQVISFNHPPAESVEPGGYVETETSRDITRSLDLALATGGATMVA